MNELTYAETFYGLLLKHAKRKIRTNDGSNRDFPVDKALRFCIEELGEASSAITRDRLILAKDECLDVAHTALLLWIAIDKEINKSIE